MAEPKPGNPQQNMTQETFDQNSEVALANECTGLAPAGLDKEKARLLAELGSSLSGKWKRKSGK